MVEGIVASRPRARVLVGLDARAVFAPLNLLRTGIGFKPLRAKPALMKL
jgi:hypothetical protein